MRFYKNALVLVLVFAVLLGTFLYVKGRNTEEAEQKGIVVLQNQTDKISSITLHKGTSIVLEKENNLWGIKEPGQYKADQTNVNTLVNDLASVKAKRIIAADTQDLTPYGLDKPAGTLTIKNTDNKTTVLVLGDKAPTGGYYLKTGESGTVYQADETLMDILDRPLSYFRDRTILSIKPEDAKGIIISQDGRTMYQLEKNEEWKFVQPKGMPMLSAVRDMIDKVLGLKVDEFVNDSPTDLAQYGLNKPTYAATVSSETAAEKVYVGKEAGDKLYYIKREGSPSVYKVSLEGIDF